MAVQDREQVHVTDVEASAGSKPGMVRYILLISLVLVIIAMSAIWISGALTSPQGDHGGAVTNQAPPAPATGN